MATPDEYNLFEQMKNERLKLEAENVQLKGHISASTLFTGDENDNLVRWQLDIKEELERIEHLLRKHIPAVDKKGNEYFEEPSIENQLFNERGIQEILNILAWYLTKNIFLSYYDEEQIRMRVHQFGDAFCDFIFNNYQNFGLDTKDKIKHYEMVCMNVINTVEAAYLRALDGGERKSLRKNYSVVQTEGLGGGMGMPGSILKQKKKFSIARPSTWS